MCVYKNKGDIQGCSNYHGIRFLSHIIATLWENNWAKTKKIIIYIIKSILFYAGKSTIKVIFLVKWLMERYGEEKNKMHKWFLLTQKKTYDKVPR